MQLTTESNDKAIQLPRLIIIGAAAGIIATGILTAVIGALPLYQSLKVYQAEHFVAEVESVSNTLEQYLTRISDITTQITSRTKAREKLQAYNDGLVDILEFREFSSRILSDALYLKPSLVGIARFDIGGRPVVQVGTSLPLDLLTIDVTGATQTRVSGPFQIADGLAIVVVAPIKDRADKVIGLDAVAFDFDELQSILRDFSQSNRERGREIYLSRNTHNGLDLLFDSVRSREGRDNPVDQVRAIELALADGRFNQGSLVATQASETNDVIAYHRFAELGWLLTLHGNAQAVYEPIYGKLVKYSLILISIILIGSWTTYRLLRPLADKVISLAKNLSEEVSEREIAERALAKRVRQQEAVAELGQIALSDPDIQSLLDHAVKVTADTLHVEYCKVLELIPERNIVLLRSGVGWQAGLVGHAEVGIEKDSQAGYTLASSGPVSVEDLTTEERFSGPQLLLDHDVRGGVSVVIDPTNPWGVFGAHSTKKRVFSKDDINFVRAIANCLAEAIERRKAEDASRASEERFRALYDDNPAMFITVDSDFCIASINQYGVRQLGYRTDEIVGEPASRICHEDDEEMLLRNLKDSLLKPHAIHRWELRKMRYDGSTIWVRETARVVEEANGDINILIICEDISEARLLSEKLSYQASHDPLTGLANRREFENRVNRAIDTARLDRVEHVLCYLDLDQFKVINDSCGHVAGDQLLCQLAELLQINLRKGDTVARLGGDEFGLLMENCGIDKAEKIANELRRKFEEYRFSWDQRTFRIGLSMGLVAITELSETITNLLRNADTACYAAKDGGRNRVHVYQEDDADLNRRHGEMQWVARINEALEENRFCLYAQLIEPIQGALKDEIHHELLIRLRGKDNSIIPPGAFLPAAERYNLAVKLDKWVVRTLFDYIENYPGLLAELGICSVNLSGQSLADADFLTYILDTLKESEIAADRICFEITETAAISNMTTALQFMKRVKELGCRFALDDFGSGLSSFAYLKALPVDYLKIDGIFVKDIVNDPADFAMVKSIHDIGKALGKTTIAEFVEDNETKLALTRIGVDYAQGYYVGRPMPLDDFDSVVNSIHSLRLANRSM